VGDDVSIDSESLFVTDFVNLNIKPTQSFRCAHINMMYLHVFIGMSVRLCFLKDGGLGGTQTPFRGGVVGTLGLSSASLTTHHQSGCMEILPLICFPIQYHIAEIL
jgi:hypothetical protein